MSNMVVQTNVLALNAHRNMKGIGGVQSKAAARLASGYKINSAADDAAGLAISEKMRSQIRGLDMASKNAQDAISLIQTAEGGMQEINNMVQRIRELIVYASNDTQEANSAGTSDRQKIQDEINQLTQEIDKTAGRVEFNKKKLLNGSYESVPKSAVAVDTLASAQNELKIAQVDYAKAVDAYDKAALGVQSARDAFANILADTNANAALKSLAGKGNTNAGIGVGDVYDALLKVQEQLPFITSASGDVTLSGKGGAASWASLGGLVSAVMSKVSALQSLMTAGSIVMTAEDKRQWASVTAVFNGGKAINSIREALFEAYVNLDAKAADLTTKVGALGEAQGTVAEAQAKYDTEDKTAGLYFQLGANAQQGMEINIRSVKSDNLGIGQGNGITLLNVLPSEGTAITAQLDTLDLALAFVTTERGKLGAAQNRLEYTIKSLDNSSENLQASESRIRDTDMAKEMMNLTKANVLQQASVSMLAQANQNPQSILQLLR